MRPDVYISADIEADGPIPGPYSMLSVGLAVAGRFDGRRFQRFDPRERTFYRELRPISENVDPRALEVSGLDRDRLAREGADPADVMRDAHAWVGEVAGTERAVVVGWPLVYDWLFLQWYFVRFAGGSPFGFSSGIDIKTLFWSHAATVMDEAGKDNLPPSLRPAAPHTHNALDDAVEQAELFVLLRAARESP